MKLCNKCGQLREHSIRTLRSGSRILQSQCKECQKKYKDGHYQENKQTYKDRLTTRRNSMKRFLKSTKNYPCTDCSVCWPSHVMHYDHLDDKVDNVSTIIRDRGSWHKLGNRNYEVRSSVR